MRSLLLIILGVVVYILFSIIVTPFLGYNFGANPTILEKTLGFFIKHPFGYFFINMTSIIGMILMLIFNGLFWSTLIIKGIPLIKKIMPK